MLIQQLPESQEGHQRLPSASKPLTIGQLARLTGISAKTIRYYESIGLLPSPERARNSYRCYNQADVNRLTLLRRLRFLGVPLADLSPLLNGISNARCIEVLQELLPLVTDRLAALDQEIAELEHLRLQVEQYRHQLVNCQPDEHESFSACLDMSCIATQGKVLPEEESHEPTRCV